jgi:hypothetical protein
MLQSILAVYSSNFEPQNREKARQKMTAPDFSKVVAPELTPVVSTM